MKKNILELHSEILDAKREKIFKDLKPFSNQGILAGGTALSLQIVHRKSYDFDLFVDNPVRKNLLRKVIKVFGKGIKLIIDMADELTFLTPNQVKISFVYFPFKRLYPVLETENLSIRHWKDIASDKAYVIGRRGEYRDYIDLFFCLQKRVHLKEIIQDAKRKFMGAFSEKLFLSQLVYFDDLKDFTVDFIGKKYYPKEIQGFLEKAVSNYAKFQ